MPKFMKRREVALEGERLCPKCELSISEDANYCGWCGTKIGD